MPDTLAHRAIRTSRSLRALEFCAEDHLCRGGSTIVALGQKLSSFVGGRLVSFDQERARETSRSLDFWNEEEGQTQNQVDRKELHALQPI